jgi:hypothetical protein
MRDLHVSVLEINYRTNSISVITSHKLDSNTDDDLDKQSCQTWPRNSYVTY